MLAEPTNNRMQLIKLRKGFRSASLSSPDILGGPHGSSGLLEFSMPRYSPFAPFKSMSQPIGRLECPRLIGKTPSRTSEKSPRRLDRGRGAVRVWDMKSTLFAMFVALLMAGCMPKTYEGGIPVALEIDLDDPETRNRIIAEAIDETEMSSKGQVGETLLYAPNEQKPYTGWAKVMYGNGRVEFLNQYENGKLNGLYTMWYENGEKESVERYKDGKPHGVCMDWYPNGRKESEEIYRDGKRHGSYTRWYENGEKQYEGVNMDGIKNGPSSTWYSNGNRKEEATWKAGKKITVFAWKPNGEKCPVTNVVDGNGVLVRYNDDGTEDRRTTYKDGEIVLD